MCLGISWLLLEGAHSQENLVVLKLYCHASHFHMPRAFSHAKKDSVLREW